MPIRIGDKPGADFTQPLRLLSDCHRRIERFLGTMLTIAEREDGRALSEDRREALETAVRYFDGAGPLHNADEEQSLFPRLRASSDPGAKAVMRILDSLEQDHRMSEAAHAEVERLARRWLAAGTLQAADARRLVGHLRDLQRLYGAHIGIEDEDVFPLAESILPPDEVVAIGREMMIRRGLDPDRPAPSGRCASRRRGALAE